MLIFKKYFIVFLSILLLAGCSSSNKIKNADVAFDLKKYGLAIPLLEKEYLEVKKPSEKSAIAYKLVKANNFVQNAEKEEQWAKTMADLDVNPEANYYYGLVLKKHEKYDEAITVFQKYLSLNKTEKLKTNAQIDVCKAAIKENKANSVRVLNLNSLNSNASDFSITKIKNKIYFTTAKKENSLSLIDDWNMDGYTDIYMANLISDTLFGANEKLDKIINGDFHDAEPTFNASGNEMYFTRCGSKLKTNDYCKIFYSKLDNLGYWTEPTEVKLMADTINVGQAFITNDSKELYFVADAAFGYGGKDIFFSKNINGTWDEPINLGPKVNSSGNEMFPFISKEGKLYFSSDGWIGLGGLDIFVAEKTGKLYSNVKRLPVTINSGGDDHGIFLLEPKLQDSITLRGYLSSSRKGGNGKDDIYYFEQSIPKAIVLPDPVILLNGLVQEQLFEDPNNPKSALKGKAPLENVAVNLFLSEGNKSALLNEYSTNAQGNFNDKIEKGSKYILSLSKEGYFNINHEFNTFETLVEDGDTITISKIFTLNKIFKNIEINIENIYYDYDKWDIRADAKPNLDSLVSILIQNPLIEIELGSHTDSRGSVDYNQELSQKRAESVVNYLISKGISKSRLVAKGYGESKPINKCIDGVTCTEEEYQQNRRTTFKIIK